MPRVPKDVVKEDCTNPLSSTSDGRKEPVGELAQARVLILLGNLGPLTHNPPVAGGAP